MSEVAAAAVEGVAAAAENVFEPAAEMVENVVAGVPSEAAPAAGGKMKTLLILAGVAVAAVILVVYMRKRAEAA